MGIKYTTEMESHPSIPVLIPTWYVLIYQCNIPWMVSPIICKWTNMNVFIYHELPSINFNFVLSIPSSTDVRKKKNTCKTLDWTILEHLMGHLLTKDTGGNMQWKYYCWCWR